MTVLYRALWRAKLHDAPDYLARTRELFVAWAIEQPQGATLEDGTTSVALPRIRCGNGEDERYTIERSVHLRSVGDPDGDHGWEGLTRQTTAGLTWTTQVRVVQAGELAHVWVENQVESDQLVGLHLQVGRPRIVDDLLGASPHILGVASSRPSR